MWYGRKYFLLSVSGLTTIICPSTLLFPFPIAIVGMVIQGLFIFEEHRKKYISADVLKGVASLMFVLLGLIGYVSYTSDSFGVKILVGLIFGLVGDVLLNLRFVIEKIGQKLFLGGIVAFLVGHILYLAALIPLTEYLVIDIVIGGVIAISLLAYIIYFFLNRTLSYSQEIHVTCFCHKHIVY